MKTKKEIFIEVTGMEPFGSGSDASDAFLLDIIDRSLREGWQSATKAQMEKDEPDTAARFRKFTPAPFPGDPT